MRALSMSIMFAIYALCGAAVAHTLTPSECKWFARDVYLDAMDRDKGQSISQQVADFKKMRCAQGAVCIYKDPEDTQRLMNALAHMYGANRNLSPVQMGAWAAEACENEAKMEELRSAHGAKL
jgi:hypothetical protein